MGFWSWVKRNLAEDTPKRRGPTRTGDDRLKREIANYLQWCKRHDPDKYRQQMDFHSGISSNRNDPIEQLKTLMALQAMAKKSGLLKDGDGGDSIDRIIDKLPELAAVAANFAQGRMPQLPRQLASPPAALPAPRAKPKSRKPVPLVVEDDDDEDEIDDEGEPAPVATEPALIYDDTPAVAAAEGVEPMPFPISQAAAAEIAVAILQGKTDPRDAAEWILSKSALAGVHGMIEVIRTTPDRQLFDVLELHAKAEPDFKPLMAFFRSRGQWAYDVAHYLRAAVPASDRRTRRGPREAPRRSMKAL